MRGWYWHRILHCAQVPGVAQVLLPHEVLALMMELGDGRLIFESEGLDPTSQAHLQRGKEVLGGGPLAAVSLLGLMQSTSSMKRTQGDDSTACSNNSLNFCSLSPETPDTISGAEILMKGS